MNDADGKVIIETELSTKQFDYQIEYLQKKLDDMIADYTTMSQEANFDEQSYDAIELRNNIEKVSNQIAGYKKQLQDVGKEAEKTDDKISKGFDKGVKSLKRFGLSLFGIQSMYRLVSKASSAYLSADVELAQKLKNVWVGLGSFLAPLIDYISNILLTGLGYLNEFIKALTGIDYIAKANANALNQQANAQKKLNNETYDFDVIRKQQDTSTSSDGISAGGQIELPQLDDNIVKKLQDLAYWLKENWTWLENVGIALGVTFGAVAIGKLLKNIGLIIGSAGAGGVAGAGLLGLQALLVAIAGVYVISMVLENGAKIKKELDELNGALGNNTAQAQTFANETKNVSNQFLELMKNGDLTEEHIKGWDKSLQITTDTIVNQYKELEKNKTWWGALTGANTEITKTQNQLAIALSQVTTDYEILYKQGRLNKEQTDNYKEALKKQIEVMEDLGYDTTELRKKYEKLTGTYTIEVKAKDSASSVLDKIKQGLGGLFSGLGTLFGGGGGTGGQRFAKGGIVTQPTRALIGEAGYPEAVVPLTDDYLSTLASLIGQYGGGGGSNTTNVYLNGRLIQREMSKQSEQISFATNK